MHADYVKIEEKSITVMTLFKGYWLYQRIRLRCG